MVGVANARTALAVVSRLRSLSAVMLEAAEMMWPRYIRDHARLKGLDLAWLEEDAAVLLVEISGESVETASATLEEQLAGLWEPLALQGGIVAQSLAQARRFWEIREDSGFYYAEFPEAASFDVSVPPTHLDAYVAQLEERLKRIDPIYAAYVYGHIADGNLHLTLIKQGPLPERELRAVEDAVYAGIREAGGSFSAEHGVGMEKRYGYETFASKEKQAVGRALKQALDPMGLFNPGKVPF
jgi:FAD/FMN-containing dehydrogenase